jgi:hypothetical protein
VIAANKVMALLAGDPSLTLSVKPLPSAANPSYYKAGASFDA